MRRIILLLLITSFILSFSTRPLYTANQNSYFLKIIADTKEPQLKQDFYYNTTNQNGIFMIVHTWLVNIFSEKIFYLINYILLAIYFLSLLTIGEVIGKIKRYTREFFLLGLFIIIIHSQLIRHLAILLKINIMAFLTEGVAQQYAIGHAFQPSTYAILYFASIAMVLKNKPIPAVLLAFIPGFFHPTYLFFSIALIPIYFFITRNQNKWLSGTYMISFYLLFILGIILLKNYVDFNIVNGNLIDQTGNVITTKIRTPQHFDFFYWFNKESFFKILLIIFGTFLIIKEKLFKIIAPLTIIFGSATILFVALNSQTLNLLTPYRISIILVPLSTLIILSKIVGNKIMVERVYLRNFLGNICIFFILFSSFYGIKFVENSFIKYNDREIVYYWAKFNNTGDKVFLIPPDWEEFTMYSLKPTYVNWKFNPVKATDVTDWYVRVNKANSFYENPSCQFEDVYYIILPTKDVDSCEVVFYSEKYSVIKNRGVV